MIVPSELRSDDTVACLSQLKKEEAPFLCCKLHACMVLYSSVMLVQRVVNIPDLQSFYNIP